ncbi:succinyltransferase [Corynebacterium poyangense]|uniref:Succinyltransferase n=1 Tax=Corynebacterium poyangense TaxID=2684405 RepID=A0A7H0SS77_9CORY|nr:DapH/DapD/GlmU-related protein [Corynebacterium poyangense]QNQ91402.1 succinyltransferase [Corynebacterium poyangense]
MDGTVLDTWFPAPQLIDSTTDSVDHKQPDNGTRRLWGRELSARMIALISLDEDRMVEQVAVRTRIADLQAPPLDAHDVYLRLHLISHRLVAPGQINMSQAMSLLSDVVWTNKGPSTPQNFELVRARLRTRGLIHVYAIDRLPRMVDYVVPDHVRIAEAERVRLGAHLAPGTTVQREGFVSHNSGSLGPCKIEGRLSSGVTLGEGCQVGLSAIIMAERQADGSRRPLQVGRDCTFGVSSGLIGMNVGDDCHIGTKVILEKDLTIYDVERDQLIPGSQLENRSGWSLNTEAEHPEPVVRGLS